MTDVHGRRRLNRQRVTKSPWLVHIHYCEQSPRTNFDILSGWLGCGVRGEGMAKTNSAASPTFFNLTRNENACGQFRQLDFEQIDSGEMEQHACGKFPQFFNL